MCKRARLSACGAVECLRIGRGSVGQRRSGQAAVLYFIMTELTEFATALGGRIDKEFYYDAPDRGLFYAACYRQVQYVKQRRLEGFLPLTVRVGRYGSLFWP